MAKMEDGTIDRISELVASLPDRWQQPFCVMIVDSRSQRAACEETGVTRGSIARWATTSRWKTAAREVQTILVGQRVERWWSLQLAADEVVADVMTDPKTPTKDRLTAAGLVYARGGLPKGVAAVDPDAGEEPSPHTPEGREALLAELAAAIPADLLEEAARRRRDAAPAHLRDPAPVGKP